MLNAAEATIILRNIVSRGVTDIEREALSIGIKSIEAIESISKEETVIA